MKGLLSVLGGTRLALLSIARSPLRASLTVLGILIGVAAVVTVTALASGARQSVSGQIESLGTNAIMVAPQNANASGARQMTGTGPRLTEDDGRAIVRDAVSVKAAAPILRARAQVIRAEKNASTQIIGSTSAFLTVRNWKVVKGSVWSEHDEAAKAKTCLLGSTVKRKLFADEDPIGQSVRVGRYQFKVAGVLETKGEAPIGGDQDDIVLVPISSMRSRVVRTPPGMVGMLLVSAESAETTDRAVKQVTSILRQRHHIEDGREPDFWIRTQKEFQATQAAIYGFLTILLVGIAAIALVVGGIGVMNIMLVSVTERTREIGIRMAIGARASDIRTQFLVEAAVLSLLGGLSGTGVGLLAIWGLGSALDWPMALDPTALAIALVASGVTGIVFGFFPARRASLLDPIVALRHE